MSINNFLEIIKDLEWYDWAMLFTLLPIIIVILIFSISLNKYLPDLNSDKEESKKKRKIKLSKKYK
ncbi:MAG: hypothetical protein RLO81_09780 [Fulvivirga sp.]|uniref:hypothetical protein n=1 Tax=Fulvivirga sp. TaxID=1931237 RepID=UPI0032EECA60